MTTSPPHPGSFLGRAARVMSRAARRRCPHCGSAGIFRSWLRLADRCPGCGLALERHEHGYRVGAYMFNIAAAELVFAAVFVAGLVLTWPDPPWEWLTWAGGALAIGLPIVFYPISQTAFLGFDLLFHPPERREFEPPQSGP